jgi:hypothetical protein
MWLNHCLSTTTSIALARIGTSAITLRPIDHRARLMLLGGVKPVLLAGYAPRRRTQCERMSLVGNRAEAGPIIYIDRSDVHTGSWDELKAGIRSLVAFVDAKQPQMVTYGFYLDEDASRMCVVSVHPDSASLERHIEVGEPEFKKLAPFLTLYEIEVFGHLSAKAAELVRQKADMLGEHGTVTFHEQFAGFANSTQ